MACSLRHVVLCSFKSGSCDPVRGGPDTLGEDPLGLGAKMRWEGSTPASHPPHPG